MQLRDAALQQPLRFAKGNATPPAPAFVSRKAVNNVRRELLRLLGLDSLYLLDRLDLTVKTSLAGDVQRQVESLLQQVTNLDYAKQSGLLGDNLLRVQTDNLNMPAPPKTAGSLPRPEPGPTLASLVGAPKQYFC